MKELLAWLAIRESLRAGRTNCTSTPRAAAEESDVGVLVVGGVALHAHTRVVTLDSSVVHLTPTEFDLLVCLAASEGVVLSRDELLARVWDWVDASGTRTVDSHIKALRRKLGADVIRTVHGVGYAFEPPAQ